MQEDLEGNYVYRKVAICEFIMKPKQNNGTGWRFMKYHYLLNENYFTQEEEEIFLEKLQPIIQESKVPVHDVASIFGDDF